jgi:hypothetical protein
LGPRRVDPADLTQQEVAVRVVFLVAGMDGEGAEAFAAARRLGLVAAASHGLVGHSARGAGEDDSAHALLGVARGEGGGGAASHRVGDDAHVFDAEVVEQRDGVFAEGAAAAIVEVVAEAKGAAVERDAGVVPGEGGDLLPPGEVVAALAVGEQDVGTAAVDLVVEVDAVDRSEGHCLEAFYIGGEGPPRRYGAPSGRVAVL